MPSPVTDAVREAARALGRPFSLNEIAKALGRKSSASLSSIFASLVTKGEWKRVRAGLYRTKGKAKR